MFGGYLLMRKRMKKSVSKEDLPKFLSGKQIKALLLDNHDNIKDQDLADFTRDFYHRLSSANLKRESFDRNENNRRLDAMSRLLVGNETCAAVAFDGTNLLISTNENKHHGNRINTTINFLIKEHDSGVDQYYFYPIIYMSLTDREPVRIQIKTPAIYYYKEKDFSLNLTSSSPRKIDATLQLGQHLLLGLPAVPMGPLITIKEKVLLKELIETNLPTRLADRERYKFFKNDIANRPNKELEVEGPLLSSPINSLQRRAEILTKHLVNIALLEKSHNDNKQKYIDKIDDYRKIVLMNSLVWEASKWYSKEFKESGATLRGFLNSKATGINKFM